MGIPRAVYETGWRHDMFTIPGLGAANESLQTNHQGSKSDSSLSFKIAVRERSNDKAGPEMNPAQARCVIDDSLRSALCFCTN